MDTLRNLSDDDLASLSNFEADEMNEYLIQLQIYAGLTQVEANRYINSQLARIQG